MKNRLNYINSFKIDVSMQYGTNDYENLIEITTLVFGAASHYFNFSWKFTHAQWIKYSRLSQPNVTQSGSKLQTILEICPTKYFQKQVTNLR